MKKAFITGLNGQDGSYLAELLLEKGYEVHGSIRRSSVFITERIDELLNSGAITAHYGDLSDSSNLNKLISSIEPDEIYNLGAQSHVAVSFEVPEYTADVTGIGTLRLLDAVVNHQPAARVYQASTSELFGGLPGTAPQSETTPFYPKSPYGAAKLYSYWIVVNYREAYGLHASNGILFNHESPRRGRTFVTKKITEAVARIKLGKQKKLFLGNLDALRDWGHAKDYVQAMWLMLQQDSPDDYVVATGECHSVRTFVNLAFRAVGIEIEWSGEGVSEVGRCMKSGEILICVDPRYFRPAEVELLHGDPSKANHRLNWRAKVSLEDMIIEMVEYDMEHAQNV